MNLSILIYLWLAPLPLSPPPQVKWSHFVVALLSTLPCDNQVILSTQYQVLVTV